MGKTDFSKITPCGGSCEQCSFLSGITAQKMRNVLDKFIQS